MNAKKIQINAAKQLKSIRRQFNNLLVLNMVTPAHIDIMKDALERIDLILNILNSNMCFRLRIQYNLTRKAIYVAQKLQ